MWPSDGDSFTILTAEKTQVKVRLHGIDSPEKNAPFGAQAKAFTSKLLFGKTIKLKEMGTDRYRRLVAIVYTSEGKVLNEELLKAGLAWHYKKHDKNNYWAKLEKQARLRKSGLWGIAKPGPTLGLQKIE